jgi:hypothetical protein
MTLKYVLGISLKTLVVFSYFPCSTPVQYDELNICIKYLILVSKLDVFIPPNWVQLHEGPNCLLVMSMENGWKDALKICRVHSETLSPLLCLYVCLVNSTVLFVIYTTPLVTFTPLIICNHTRLTPLHCMAVSTGLPLSASCVLPIWTWT